MSGGGGDACEGKSGSAGVCGEAGYVGDCGRDGGSVTGEGEREGRESIGGSGSE